MNTSDSFYATILDNAAPTLVTDLRGRIIYVNRPTLCLLEGYYSPKKTSGCNVNDRLEPRSYVGDHYTKILEPLDSYEATSLHNHFMGNTQMTKGTEVRRTFKCRTFKNKRPIILEFSTRTCMIPKNSIYYNATANLRHSKNNASECRCENRVDVDSVKERKGEKVDGVHKGGGDGEDSDDDDDGDEQFYDASEDSEEGDFNAPGSHCLDDPEQQEMCRNRVSVKGGSELQHKVTSTGNPVSIRHPVSPSENSSGDPRSKLRTQKNQVVVVVDPCSSVDTTKNTVLISTIRDVTDSKFVDFVLNEADNRITITYDVTGLILEVSRSCKHILGFDPNELLGLDGYAYIHPDDATEVRMYHSKRASEPYGTTLQIHCFRHQRKDGTYCLLEIWSQGIQSNGRWTFVGFDITNTTERAMENRGLIPDQAIVRRRLLHNTDNNERNRVANNFVSFICHELRNPLNGIIGYTTFILDTELTRQQRDYADAISSISNHMCNIINQSLDLCQTQSHGTYISEIGPLHLSEVVKFCFLTVTVLARNKGTELRMRDNLTSFQKLRVQGENKNSKVNESCAGWYGDEDTIRKILLNYLTNAIKHTGSGSVTVVLDVENEKLPDGKDGFMARCSVEDTGPGIPQKNLKRLFLPYSKLVSSFGEIDKYFDDFVDGATHRQQDQLQRSSGLGLSICKELADKIGGKVGVESKLGYGSKFWFTFPIYTSMPEDFDDENDFGAVIGDVSDKPCVSCDGHKKIFKRRRTPTTDSIASTHSVSSNSSSSSSRPNSGYTNEGSFLRSGSLRKSKKPAKVLMVEDNEINQKVAIKYLEKMGEEVTVAANGVEALEKMKNESFDILFVDLQMPFMDGYTLTRRIREAEREFCQCGLLSIPPDSHSTPLTNKNVSSFCSHTIATIRQSPTGSNTSSSSSSSSTSSTSSSSSSLLSSSSPSTLPSPTTSLSHSSSNISPSNSQHDFETSSHKHHHKHLPIVACTGSVLDREKDKCRQYGMDGFLTKPYRLEEMRSCIEELVDASDKSRVDGSHDDHGHVQIDRRDNHHDEKANESLHITPI